MKVKVEKVTENDNSFRTPIKELDYMVNIPEKGSSLILQSTTHESGGIITSIVQEVEFKEDYYIVKTLNSTYKITPEEGVQ